MRTDAGRVADAARHFVNVAAGARGCCHVALAVDGHRAHRVARSTHAAVRVVAVGRASRRARGLLATGARVRVRGRSEALWDGAFGRGFQCLLPLRLLLSAQRHQIESNESKISNELRGNDTFDKLQASQATSQRSTILEAQFQVHATQPTVRPSDR